MGPIYVGPRGARNREPNHWSALLPFGEFWIEHKKRFWLTWESRHMGHFESLEAAQVEAQALLDGWFEELREEETIGDGH